MRIAIIGAGLSGLCCAITLEKNGLEVDVFEKRGKVGDRFVIAEAMFSMTQHPIHDAVQYLSETYDIHLKPSSNIQKLQCYSQNERCELHGHLGFINMRGKHQDSYESQLAAQLKTDIQFLNEVSYDDISRKYTHVVLATGDALDTKKLQPYDIAFKATFRGAMIEGDFDQTETHAFFNNDIAPKGMAYLLPHSDKLASLVLVYPQYRENEDYDKEELWKKCFQECCRRLDQDFTVIRDFSLKDYIVGKAEHSRIGNTFFVGNCWGAISPVFGIGQFESMLTGIYAAQDIAGQGDYANLTKHLSQGYHDSLSLRRGLEKLDNDQLDLITKSISNKFAEKFITSQHINLFKIVGRALHPFSRKA